MKNIKLLILGLIIFSFAQNCLANNKNTKSTDWKPINQLVDKFYPTYKIATIEDEDSAKSCGKEMGYKGFIKADFRGEGKSDYAVLLSGKSDSNILVVFLKENNGVYKPILIEKEAGDIIEVVKKGERIDADEDLLGKQEGNHVMLKNPAIESVFCERSSAVYYWNKKTNRFIKVWTSD